MQRIQYFNSISMTLIIFRTFHDFLNSDTNIHSFNYTNIIKNQMKQVLLRAELSCKNL